MPPKNKSQGLFQKMDEICVQPGADLEFSREAGADFQKTTTTNIKSF